MFRPKSSWQQLNSELLWVSILVLVDVSLEDFNPEECAVIVEVSILVLVDVSPEAPHLCRAERPAMVSILVLVDVSLEAQHLCRAERPAMVSILVLVDVSLEVRSAELDSGLLWGFNPCSRGCFARSLRVAVIPDHDTQFQSLFSWMFRSKYRRIAISCLILRFQSLFSWMFRSKTSVLSFPGTPTCFNPCSRGCFARSMPDDVARFLHLVFQSLFSWMFRSKRGLPG